MKTVQFCHGTFTLRRSWAASPARVFSAWADPQIKAQWFTGPPDEWTLIRRSLDFRSGGAEVLEGSFSKSGMVSLYEARFHLIEQDRRLVYAYDMHLNGSFHSVTLSSLTLQSEGRKTQVLYTEQIVFIDGQDGTESREHGTARLFEQIEHIVSNKD